MGTRAPAGGALGGALRRALHTASTVASFCVEGVGTKRTAALTQDDVKRRQADLRTLVHPGD